MSSSSGPRVFIASDHAGFELKNLLVKGSNLVEWADLGPFTPDRVDYPDFAHDLCSRMLNESSNTFGVLICGSGQGMAIAANRHRHIRAALCWNSEIAKLSREHNNANVLCLGARFTQANEAIEILKIFLSSRFEGGRHAQRVAKMNP